MDPLSGTLQLLVFMICLFFSLLGLQPASLAQRVSQQKLDMRVYAAKLIRRPSLQSFVDSRVKPQGELLLRWHNGLPLIQTARVDDWLCPSVGDDRHQQVVDHVRLALFIQRHDPVLLQLRDRHLDHAHRSFDDRLPRCHDS